MYSTVVIISIVFEIHKNDNIDIWRVIFRGVSYIHEYVEGSQYSHRGNVPHLNPWGLSWRQNSNSFLFAQSNIILF